MFCRSEVLLCVVASACFISRACVVLSELLILGFSTESCQFNFNLCNFNVTRAVVDAGIIALEWYHM